MINELRDQSGIYNRFAVDVMIDNESKFSTWHREESALEIARIYKNNGYEVKMYKITEYVEDISDLI